LQVIPGRRITEASPAWATSPLFQPSIFLNANTLILRDLRIHPSTFFELKAQLTFAKKWIFDVRNAKKWLKVVESG
jgi:hypothetical protein